MTRRAEIRMSADEMLHFLGEERVVTCASIGPHGRPHLMPLWYVVSGGLVTAWTYGKSQKVRNLERTAQATIQVEAGDAYDELRGVMIEADVEIVREPKAVAAIGAAIAIKYLGVANATPDTPEIQAYVAPQAPKRVGLRFHPTRIVSWDHRKLGRVA